MKRGDFPDIAVANGWKYRTMGPADEWSVATRGPATLVWANTGRAMGRLRVGAHGIGKRLTLADVLAQLTAPEADHTPDPTLLATELGAEVIQVSFGRHTLVDSQHVDLRQHLARMHDHQPEVLAFASAPELDQMHAHAHTRLEPEMNPWSHRHVHVPFAGRFADLVTS